MATEVLKYSVRRETRSGLFGLRRKYEDVEDLLGGENRLLTVGGHKLGLKLEPDLQALILWSGDRSFYVVEFAAEPQRFKDKVSMKLGEGEIRTGRRAVTVYPEEDPMHRVILKAPRFQPLILTSDQVAGIRERYKGNPVYYNQGGNLEELFASK